MHDNGTLQPLKSLPVIRYEIDEQQIAETKAKYAALDATTPKGYEQVRTAIAEVRAVRVKIEKRRTELKAEALEFGRQVDAEAKKFTALILEIEEPLKAKKQAIDDEKERIKREKEEAERAALEARLRAEREAEEARLRSIREEEELRLAEERKRLEAERAALAEQQRKIEEAQRIEREKQEAAAAAERKRIEEEQRAERERLARERAALEQAQKAERERIEAENRRIADEQRKLDEARQKAIQEDIARNARIKAEQEAKAKAEREAREAEERRIAEMERQAELARRMEALKPDVEKLDTFAATLRMIQPPQVSSEHAKEAVGAVVKKLAEAVSIIGQFVAVNTKAAS